HKSRRKRLGMGERKPGGSPCKAGRRVRSTSQEGRADTGGVESANANGGAGGPAAVALSMPRPRRVGIASDIQALFFRRRHQPRRPPLAKIRPGVLYPRWEQARSPAQSKETCVAMIFLLWVRQT